MTETTTGQAGVVTDAPVLQVTDLSVDFGVDNVWIPAAKKLNYQIKAGEVLAILRTELENTLRLLGRNRIGALDAAAVRRRRAIFD